jgi:hypothetical protein
MKPEDSSACPQEPATASYVEPVESSPRLNSYFRLPNGLFSSGLPTEV